MAAGTIGTTSSSVKGRLVSGQVIVGYASSCAADSSRIVPDGRSRTSFCVVIVFLAVDTNTKSYYGTTQYNHNPVLSLFLLLLHQLQLQNVATAEHYYNSIYLDTGQMNFSLPAPSGCSVTGTSSLARRGVPENGLAGRFGGSGSASSSFADGVNWTILARKVEVRRCGEVMD